MKLNHDVCENNLFLNEVDKVAVNRLINSYFDRLKLFFEQIGLKGKVYYTGSLARKEVSVNINDNNEITLLSDIDFVVGTDEDFSNDEIYVNLTQCLNEKFPEFSNSVVITTIDKLTSIKSCIGRDLAIVIDNPIYQSDFNKLTMEVKLSKKQRLEPMLHSLGGYYLHPKITGIDDIKMFKAKDFNYQYLKTILECLRSQFSEEDSNVIGYSGIIKNIESNKLKKLLDKETIVKLVSLREKYNPGDLPKINFGVFTVNAILGAFGCSDEQELEEKLKDGISENLTLNHLYERLIVAYILYCIKGEEWEHVLNLLFKKIPSLENQKLTNEVKEELSRVQSNTNNFRDIVKIMMEYRMVYISEIYFNNTNERIIPDLNYEFGNKQRIIKEFKEAVELS
jgi:hypothetical protein